MKKLLLTALALAFAVSFTFAQMNKSDVTQTGSNTTDVTQTNNGGVAGQDNMATINVSGNGSDMDIEQRLGPGSSNDGKDNIATINSSGGNSVGSVTQRNNQAGAEFIADINQTDGNNSATVDQRGRGVNTAYVNQSVGNATVTIEQIHGDASGDVDATVNQSGANTADIFQKNRNLDVILNQTNTAGAGGVANEASIAQGFNDGKVVGSDARVTQIGEANMVDLDQDRISAPFSHDATLFQEGYGNSIGLQQDGSAPGDGAVADISQTGDYNTFRGLGGDAQAFQGSSSRVIATTNGSNNLIEMNQGVNSEATLTQDGDWNVITMDQASNSTVTVDQDAMGGTPTNSNTATISSSDGSVNITQTNN